MLLDEKIIGFERFWVANIAWECAGIKNTRVCIVYDISENFKNFIFSKSKIFLQGEPVVCRRIACSASRAKPLISIGFSIVVTERDLDGFLRQIMTVLQKNFRSGNFKIFENFRNVGNNAHASIFDPYPLPRDASNENPSKIIDFSSQNLKNH